MASNFKPWVDNPTAGQQVLSAESFSTDEERVSGFVGGKRASAIRVNSGLRQANLVVAALMSYFDSLVTLPADLSLMSTAQSVQSAIAAAVNKKHADTLSSAQAYADAVESKVNAAITALQTPYERTITANQWSGLAGNYRFIIAATTHGKGKRPSVSTYVNGEQTYDSPVINLTTGDVTVHSNIAIDLLVVIK